MDLTVIVTVYNIEQYLPRFFDSMAAQTFRDYYLLMLDDGSTDNSLAVCKEYAKKDTRIQVVELEHVGIAKARNIAMEYIHTKYTAYVDGDDYVENDYLKHLVDAREKYDADMVISRVVYRLEKDNVVEGTFAARGEKYISKETFTDELPMLLQDRRLNYLYGKIYKTELLRNIRVEDDVRQGSDTMINCQYVERAQSIVLIDDLDYNYIKYNTRSVTSYSGEDAFSRICRINDYVYQYMKKAGYLSNKMVYVIDERVLLSAIWCVTKILSMDIARDEKERQITTILHNDIYVKAFERQRNHFDRFSFSVIPPQNGRIYLRAEERRQRINKRKERILKKSPRIVISLYRRLKRRG